jgi:hypothetical protein
MLQHLGKVIKGFKVIHVTDVLADKSILVLGDTESIFKLRAAR